jgi:hypothetical protein
MAARLRVGRLLTRGHLCLRYRATQLDATQSEKIHLEQMVKSLERENSTAKARCVGQHGQRAFSFTIGACGIAVLFPSIERDPRLALETLPPPTV